MSKIITTRTQELYDKLCVQLNNTRNGKRFHSRRKIMEQFRETRYVVDQVLQRLTDENMITIQEREGIFVTKGQQNAKMKIISFHDDWPSEQMQHFDLAVSNIFAKSPEKYHFSTQLYAFEEKRFTEQIETLDADVILLYPPRSLNKHDLVRLCALPQTVVFCCNTLYYAGVDAVDLQPGQIGMTAAHHLIENGHRELAILISEPQCPASAERINSFLHLARLNGIEPVIIDSHITEGDYSPTMAYNALSEHLARHGADFTGIFVLSDASAFGALKALKDFNLKIPEDISILSSGGLDIGEFSSPPLTTVSENFAEYAAVIKAGVDDLAAGKKFGIRSVNPILIERQSVKNMVS